MNPGYGKALLKVLADLDQLAANVATVRPRDRDAKTLATENNLRLLIASVRAKVEAKLERGAEV
jgi:hypothetical protein